MESETLANKPWSYTLYKLSNGAIVLSVVCGRAGLYHLNIPLNAATAARAVIDEPFLATIANDIRSFPEKYADRSIRL